MRRYKEELKSVYLCNIDKDRVKAECALVFEHFYKLVDGSFI